MGFDNPELHRISTDHEPTVKLKVFSDIEMEKAPEESSIMYYELGAFDSQSSMPQIEHTTPDMNQESMPQLKGEPIFRDGP